MIDFDATGLYCCEVSLESPIFTKASNEEQVHVFRKLYLIDLHFPIIMVGVVSVPQNLPPTMSFAKRQFYIGEKLVANCTTSKAKPGKLFRANLCGFMTISFFKPHLVPHIVWLINGKKVISNS